EKSAVTDPEGKPTLVYHGTSAQDFEGFDIGDRGAWFGEDPRTASMYAIGNDSMVDGAKRGENPLPRVVPAFLSIQNPYVVTEADWQDMRGDSASYQDKQRALTARAKAAGHDGISYGDGVWTAFRPEQIKSVFNRGGFDPNDPGILNQEEGARGEFSPATSTMSLLAKADLSTFLHEGAHFYLEVMSDLASAPDAPAELRADMETLLKWFGVGSLDQWRGMTLNQKRPYHEQFARGFEARLFEGTSPSLELAGIFRRFRAWLVNIYKSISALDADLTDEVRSVMDRLIASDAQIQEAKAARAYEPLFKSAEDAQMTPEQFTDYQAQATQATDEASDKLTERSARDMKWLSNAKSRALKALQKEANEKRKAVREEVTSAVRAEPIYSALRFLTRGEITVDGDEIAAQVGHKLSIPALEELYANTNGAPDWRRLTNALGREGLPPDVVADMFGFQSGDQMVRALIEAPKEADEIARRTDKAMLERFGDISSPGALSEAANEAITNQAHVRFVATELAAVSGMVGRARDLIRAASGVADRIIGSKKVRDIRPRQYIGSETKAAKSAEKALAKGDRKEAARFKRQQLLQVTMLRGAMDAKEEIDTALASFRKMFAGKDEDIAKRRDMALVYVAMGFLGF
ncbi:MAG: hypothetical protein ACREBK_04365, partial [Sphingomicrobium sp.]